MKTFQIPVRGNLLLPVCAAVLLGLAGWSLIRMQSAYAAAATARDNRDACKHLAARLQTLRRSPQQASTNVRSASALTQDIETAARSAQITPPQIVQIDPQPARRVGNTPYQEQPTRIEFRDLTLPQLLAFATALIDSQASADVAEIRLSAARDEPAEGQSAERWAAELTVVDRIFSPDARTTKPSNH